jgi:hypothetical protein
MKPRIIHWTDPDYLEAFYRGWGSGQSITSRQAQSIRPEGHSSPSPAVEDDDDVASSEGEE